MEGRWDECLALARRSESRREAYIWQGRYDELLAMAVGDEQRRILRAQQASAEGRFSEAFDHIAPIADSRGAISLAIGLHLRCGRVREAIALADPYFDRRVRRLPRQYRLLEETIRGDAAAAQATREELRILPQWFDLGRTGWCFDWVIRPFLDHLGGDAEALVRSQKEVETRFHQNWAGLAWCASSLATGRLDELEVRQRLRLKPALDPLVQLCLAIRAEVEGRRESACDRYRAYLSLPFNRRHMVGDPVVDRFAAWRLEALGGGSVPFPPPARSASGARP